MLRAEAKLGRPLEDWFEEKYQTLTQPQMAAELKALGLKVSDASISRWMRELGIEARLPGQRPPAALEATA